MKMILMRTIYSTLIESLKIKRKNNKITSITLKCLRCKNNLKTFDFTKTDDINSFVSFLNSEKSFTHKCSTWFLEIQYLKITIEKLKFTKNNILDLYDPLCNYRLSISYFKPKTDLKG